LESYSYGKGGVMHKVRRADLSELPENVVLIVDTEDEIYKIVPGYTMNGFRAVKVSTLDENDRETEKGNFFLNTICVGQPLRCLSIPNTDEKIISLQTTLVSSPIESIEVYGGDDTECAMAR